MAFSAGIEGGSGHYDHLLLIQQLVGEFIGSLMSSLDVHKGIEGSLGCFTA